MPAVYKASTLLRSVRGFYYHIFEQEDAGTFCSEHGGSEVVCDDALEPDKARVGTGSAGGWQNHFSASNCQMRKFTVTHACFPLRS